MSKAFVISLATVTLLIGLAIGFTVSRMPSNTSNERQQTSDSSMQEKSFAAYSDQQFLEDMIAHHEDAVSMSRRVLEHTSRKEIKTMATTIIDVQTKEIDQMNHWLNAWK